MSKKMASVLFAVFFLVFIAIMDYPYIARIMNDREQSEVVHNYQANAKSILELEKEQMLEDAINYNKELATGLSLIGEVSFQNEEIIDEEYEGILAIRDHGAMGLIRIPKIDVSLSIFPGTSSEVLGKGSGHLEGSSLPVGGESTHTCLTAHRGLADRKMFTYLDQLREGDVFFIDVLDETLAYQVYGVEIVLPHEVETIKIIEGEDLATLITCTPYGINSHRIFVHGERIPYDGNGDELDASLATKVFQYWWLVATIAALIFMAIMLYWFNKEPKPSRTSL